MGSPGAAEAQIVDDVVGGIVVAVGGGSGIDATKTAVAHMVLGDKHPDLDDYFGVGQVTEMLEAEGRSLETGLPVELS